MEVKIFVTSKLLLSQNIQKVLFTMELNILVLPSNNTGMHLLIKAMGFDISSCKLELIVVKRVN